MSGEPCDELWEPAAKRQQTHSCELRVPHPLPHHCASCESDWYPGGQVVLNGVVTAERPPALVR